MALEEDDSEEAWEEERSELFFLFFPKLKLVPLLVLLPPPLPTLVEFGMTGIEDPEELSLGLKEDDLVVLLLDERDLSARPEAREGAEEEEEWAEGICGDEDTCRACAVPWAGCSAPPWGEARAFKVVP